VIWWPRKKKRNTDRALDAYIAEERAAAEAVHEDTQRQAEEVRSLRAESSRVNAEGKRIREQNGFTSLLTRALRGVQEDGR
jgi:hypothetical protein